MIVSSSTEPRKQSQNGWGYPRSGQRISYHKYRFQFSADVQSSDRRKLAEILNISPSNHIGTYQGCHNIDKKRSKPEFEGV